MSSNRGGEFPAGSSASAQGPVGLVRQPPLKIKRLRPCPAPEVILARKARNGPSEAPSHKAGSSKSAAPSSSSATVKFTSRSSQEHEITAEAASAALLALMRRANPRRLSKRMSSSSRPTFVLPRRRPSLAPAGMHQQGAPSRAQSKRSLHPPPLPPPSTPLPESLTCIPKTVFKQLVYEILSDMYDSNAENHQTPSRKLKRLMIEGHALEILQKNAEAHLIELFQSSYLLSCYRGAFTLRNRDLQVALRFDDMVNRKGPEMKDAQVQTDVMGVKARPKLK